VHRTCTGGEGRKEEGREGRKERERLVSLVIVSLVANSANGNGGGANLVVVRPRGGGSSPLLFLVSLSESANDLDDEKTTRQR
jgi:hypothetical protein